MRWISLTRAWQTAVAGSASRSCPASATWATTPGLTGATCARTRPDSIDLGVDTLLLLVEDTELEDCRVTDIAEVLPAFGVELIRFPVEDPLTPTDGVAFRETIVAALERVRSGSFLAIACRGGLDRSGLAAACLLREAGLGADDAIDRVHVARRRSLKIHEQQAFVRAWPPKHSGG